MIIIPAIDLRDGCCVRLSRGRKDSAIVYSQHPADVAVQFASEGAEMLHVVDLDGAFAEPNSRNRAALSEIVNSVDIPVQFGGGLRTNDDVAWVLDSGVQRVVIGTISVESPDTLIDLLTRFGASRIVVGIDATNGKVATRGWESESGIDAVLLARRVAAAGVERIVYTDIECDGMLAGPNVSQTIRIARESGLKVTASGGVSSFEDLLKLRAAESSGVDSVIVGRALYEKRLSLKEAIEISINPS